MKLLQTINKTNPEQENYEIRHVVRCLILDETGMKALFFGDLLPGGGVDDGESDEDAVKRECMEEVGARVEIERPLGEVVAYRDFLKRKYMTHGYVCKQVGEFEKPTTTELDEQNTKMEWQEISFAIDRLEKQIQELIEAYNPETADEDAQRRIFVRQTSLAFLKEFINNKNL